MNYKNGNMQGLLRHTVLKKNWDQNFKKITERVWEIICGGIFWGYIWGQILHRNPSGTPDVN